MFPTFQMLSAQWLTDSLKVTAIGLIVVFAVLAILIVLIEALHFVLKDRKKEEPAPAPKKQQEEKRISAGVMADVPEADKAQEDAEFIAAVSSAITCVTGNANFKIKSIKKG